MRYARSIARRCSESRQLAVSRLADRSRRNLSTSAHPATAVPLDLLCLLAFDFLGLFGGLRASQLDGVLPRVGDLRPKRAGIAQRMVPILRDAKLVMWRLALEQLERVQDGECRFAFVTTHLLV